MAVLSGPDLLDLWEQVEGLAPARRALVLAAAGGDSGPVEPEAVSAMPVGARDARLLELRRDLAGPLLEAIVRCPACDEEVEAAIDADVLLGFERRAADPITTETGGLAVVWRSPTAGDLDAIAAFGADHAETELWRRCVLEVRPLGAGSDSPLGADPDGDPDNPDHATDLPDDVRAVIAAEMAAADPLAEVLLDVACAACGESFPAEIDVATFAWAELASAAQRVLREVDVLARAYGWTDPEVLGLSDARRAAYLELALGNP